MIGRAYGGEDGFTLVGLMIAVVVINVALGVAATSVVTIDRRAREAETIFRGGQIARGIECYRQAESRYPETLAELVEADCLRREYRDPMSRGGEWRLLTEQELRDGTVATLLGVEPPGEQEDGSATGSFGSGFGLGTDDDEGPFGFRQSTQQGIVGVTPGAEGPSMRHFGGRSRYEEWVFLAESTAG